METCFTPWPCVPVGFHTDTPVVNGKSDFPVVLSESERDCRTDCSKFVFKI